MTRVNTKLISSQVQQIVNDHPEIVDELSGRLELVFLDQRDDEGNLCFMDNDEVRPEFRTLFTATDVKYYLIGLFASGISTEANNLTDDFPFPENATSFWKYVSEGRNTLR